MTEENKVQPVKPAEAIKTEQQEERTIPVDRFNEVNNRAKEAEAKLAAFEAEKVENEKKALEESGKFKELYEKSEAEKTKLALDVKKISLVQEAINSKELHPSLSKMITGSTEEELKASLDSAKAYHKDLVEQFKTDKTATDNAPGKTKTEVQIKGVDEFVKEFNENPDNAFKALMEETNAIK
jgi:hypothetical protein